MKMILVTGGAGFIGSNFIKYMLSKRSDVVIVNMDKLTYAGNLENLKEVEGNPNYSFFRGDICDTKDVEWIFEKYRINTVINFAAESHVDKSIINPLAFAETNYMGVCNLLNVSRKKDVSFFLQVSTDEVYGSLGSDGYFTEASLIKPNSPYAASKAAADLMVRAFYKTYNFPAVVTRCCNNYGPYQFPEKLIPLIISNAIENRHVPVYGDGSNVRDWIYVLDHCRAIELVMEKGVAGEVYNIGTNCELKNLTLIEKILDMLGKSRNLIRFVDDRPGHDKRYAIDASKITREFNFTSAYPFDEALEETVRWYVENIDWWQRVKEGSYTQYYDEWYKNKLGLKE
jgi:dTDP-glucose 4,6-dehydratase